jgi:alpha-tubulin suppressor-like RCC1 family protein
MPVNYRFKLPNSTLYYFFDEVFVPIDFFSLGDMFSWGYNTYGQLALDDTNNRSSPTKLYKNNFDVKKVSAGFDFMSILLSNGSLWTCGNEQNGKLGNGSTGSYQSNPIQIFSQYTWKDISCGHTHMGAITTEGHMYLWGTGNNGELGDGAGDSYLTPMREVTQSKNWIYISCGKSFTFGLTFNNILLSWGINDKGQLGIGNTDSKSTPTAISGTWKQVSAGESHVAAISTSGNLYTCGKNNNGQLGNGTTTNSANTNFSQVGSDIWRQVSCGAEHTVAIKTDGTMWACGSNFYGQLGVGSEISDSSTLVQIETDINWRQVHCGLYNTIAIKTDGTVWVWGNNNDNILGLGNSANQKIYLPTQITSITNAKQVSAGNSNFYAIRYQDVYI